MLLITNGIIIHLYLRLLVQLLGRLDDELFVTSLGEILIFITTVLLPSTILFLITQWALVRAIAVVLAVENWYGDLLRRLNLCDSASSPRLTNLHLWVILDYFL